MRDRIVIYLNGQSHEVGAQYAGTMLADYLRYVRGLTGTKIVCAEGDCGACTVLRWFPLGKAPGKPSYVAVNSCILTMAQLDGSTFFTVDAPRGGRPLAGPDGNGEVPRPMRADKS